MEERVYHVHKVAASVGAKSSRELLVKLVVQLSDWDMRWVSADGHDFLEAFVVVVV